MVKMPKSANFFWAFWCFLEYRICMTKKYKISLSVSLGETVIKQIVKTYGAKYKFVFSQEQSTTELKVYNLCEYFSKEDLIEISKICNFKELKDEVAFFEILIYSNIAKPTDGSGNGGTGGKKTDMDDKYVKKEEYNAFRTECMAKFEVTDAKIEKIEARIESMESRIESMDAKIDANHAECISKINDTNAKIDKLQDLVLKLIDTIGGSGDRK
jgi:hypothetical protein